MSILSWSLLQAVVVMPGLGSSRAISHAFVSIVLNTN